MEKFISKNKRTISLPVPLGTELYVVNTRCGDYCLFQKEEFNKLISEEEGGRCTHNLPCHTRPLAPRKVILGINNLELLNEWKKRVFTNKEDAEQKTIEIINENIKFLKEHNIKVDKNGYSETGKEEK